MVSLTYLKFFEMMVKKIGWCWIKNCHFCLLLINKNVGVSSYKVSLSTKLDSPRSETTTVNKPHEKFRLLKSPAWFYAENMHRWMVTMCVELTFGFLQLITCSNQAILRYPLPVPDTRVFGNSSTRYPGIKIGGFLQWLICNYPAIFRYPLHVPDGQGIWKF